MTGRGLLRLAGLTALVLGTCALARPAAAQTDSIRIVVSWQLAGPAPDSVWINYLGTPELTRRTLPGTATRDSVVSHISRPGQHVERWTWTFRACLSAFYGPWGPTVPVCSPELEVPFPRTAPTVTWAPPEFRRP